MILKGFCMDKSEKYKMFNVIFTKHPVNYMTFESKEKASEFIASVFNFMHEDPLINRQVEFKKSTMYVESSVGNGLKDFLNSHSMYLIHQGIDQSTQTLDEKVLICKYFIYKHDYRPDPESGFKMHLCCKTGNNTSLLKIGLDEIDGKLHYTLFTNKIASSDVYVNQIDYNTVDGLESSDIAVNCAELDLACTIHICEGVDAKTLARYLSLLIYNEVSAVQYMQLLEDEIYGPLRKLRFMLKILSEDYDEIYCRKYIKSSLSRLNGNLDSLFKQRLQRFKKHRGDFQ